MEELEVDEYVLVVDVHQVAGRQSSAGTRYGWLTGPSPANLRERELLIVHALHLLLDLDFATNPHRPLRPFVDARYSSTRVASWDSKGDDGVSQDRA